MSADVAISAEGLAKRYRIGERQRYGSLRDSVASTASTLIRPGRRRRMPRAHIWALDDVSFEISEGEAVGIIGANGAGKSTLLKILSRITEPTNGEARIYGRVASLLEVGTGFHPELTGRENIFLNGAILGMRKREIEASFDEIVDFSGVEKFIDTPVKRYSSGMHVRLAFAVAAHLTPEILLIDEVLAVGDYAFQQKCLGKMGEVARAGRTVVFVSHNLASLANLCSRAVLLVEGRTRAEGSVRDVIDAYLALGAAGEGERRWAPDTAPTGEQARIDAVRIISGGGVTADTAIDEAVHVEVDYTSLKPGARLSVSIHLLDKMGVGVLASANMPSATLEPDEWFAKPHAPGHYRSRCTIPADFLNDGRYAISALVLSDVTRIEATAADAIAFTVHDTGSMRKEYGDRWLGVVRPRLGWQTMPVEGIPAREGGV